jgi:hypothetical protein
VGPLCNLEDPSCKPGTAQFEAAAARVQKTLKVYDACLMKHHKAKVS